MLWITHRSQMGQNTYPYLLTLSTPYHHQHILLFLKEIKRNNNIRCADDNPPQHARTLLPTGSLVFTYLLKHPRKHIRREATLHKEEQCLMEKEVMLSLFLIYRDFCSDNNR